ncbi:MAG: RNA-binding domain-containing protein [Thermoplasmatota archaeon]
MIAEGSVRIFPTEDPERVHKSIEVIFPDSDITKEGDLFSFSTSDLSIFIEKLKEQRIRNTAAMIIGKCMENEDPVFYLNKQAAYAGSINFTDGDSTLGDILIRIRSGGDTLVKTLEKGD